MDINTVILAGGNGRRMNFPKSKVLMPLCGKSILEHIIDNLCCVGINDILIVCNNDNKKDIEKIKNVQKIVVQNQQNGTAGAVKVAINALNLQKSHTLIINGDGPVLCTSTLLSFTNSCLQDLRVLVCEMGVHSTYGRVKKDAKNRVERVVEYKDATLEEKNITMCNAGVYLFNTKKLIECIDLIKNQNASKEYYLTDLINIFYKKNYAIDTMFLDAQNDYLSVNTMQELEQQNQKMQNNIKSKLIEDGVLFVNSNSVYIDSRAKIGAGCIIFGGVSILGGSLIKSGCTLNPNCVIENSLLEENTIVPSGVVIRNNEVM